jgi:hypothetical protein
VTGRPVEQAHYERSDISVVPAAGVVGEAMVMLTLLDFVLEKFGGDTVDDTVAAVERYLARIAAGPGRRAVGSGAMRSRAVADAAGAAEPEAARSAAARTGTAGTEAEVGSGGDD